MNDPRLDLRDLVEAYAMAADARDAAGFAALFTPDAILVVHDATGVEQGRYVGRDEIARIPERLRRYDSTMHHMTNHRVRLDDGSNGARATGESYCIAHHLIAPGPDDGSTVDHVLHIRYEDRYLRSEDGWRIVHRDVRVQWVDDRAIG